MRMILMLWKDRTIYNKFKKYMIKPFSMLWRPDVNQDNNKTVSIKLDFFILKFANY